MWDLRATIKSKHSLVACPSLQDIRLKYFMVSSVKELCDSVDNQSFITETHFYSKLWCLLSQFYISLITLILRFFLYLLVFAWFYLQLSGTE